MRIGIVSDSHGRMANVEKALSILTERQVQTVIHCGDIDDAATVRLFAGWDAHFVLGNCDDDYEGLKKAIEQAGAKLHEPFGILDLACNKIGFTHGHLDQVMRDLKRRDDLNYLFYGHTHLPDEYLHGSMRVINPGALHRASTKTFVILDLSLGELEYIAV